MAGLKQIAPEQFGFDQARHLLWRAGFGGTPDQIQLLASWGPERSVDHLLDSSKGGAEPVRADEFDKDIMRPPSEDERRMLDQARRAQNEEALARARAEVQRREQEDRRQVRKVQRWWLTRMIETPAPLQEKMTLFWHGHFATSYRTIENSYHMFLQNQLFRKHAVGSYADLLRAIIRDPAMIAYLDNNDSRRGRPNENLAREVMELFSLGVGNYTEKDIKEGARALTGYTFRDDEFYFDQRNHDTGGKVILGRSGEIDGDGFVDAILAQRACGDYMTSKLYRFFARDLPDDERAIDRDTRDALRSLASTFRASEYSTRAMLRELFLSEHFYSPEVMNEQIKSPVVLIVGAIRSLNAPPRDLSILLDAIDLMGQNILYPPSVAGWDGGRSWINTSTMFIRQNIMNYLLTGRKPQGYDALADKQQFDPMPLLDGLKSAGAIDAGRAVEYLLRLTIGRAPDGHKAVLTKFFDDHEGRVEPSLVTGALLLISAMPEYQLC